MMEQASLQGLVKTAIFIVLAIIVIRLISRVVLPYMLRYLGKKASEKAASNMRDHYGRRRERKNVIKDDGDVSIEYIKDKKKQNSDDDSGEYVDYEDVSDKN